VTKKIDVTRILNKGSARQRTLLMANHLAESFFGKEGCLSEIDFNTLFDSLKTAEDVRVYNRVRNAEQNLRFFLVNLNQLRLEYFDVLSQLNGYVLLRKSYKQLEEIVNTVVSSVKEKAPATDAVKKFNLSFATIDTDPEGYILIDTRGKVQGNKTGTYNLDSLLEKTVYRLNELRRRIKTGVQVARNYMDETGVSIKEYEKKLQEIEQTIRKRIPIYQHYALIEDYDGLTLDQKLYEQFKEQSFGNG